MPLQIVEERDFDHNYRNAYLYYQNLAARSQGLVGHNAVSVRIYSELSIRRHCTPRCVAKDIVVSLEEFFKNGEPVIPQYGFIPVVANKRVLYVSLVPKRQWIQGFHKQRICTSYIDLDGRINEEARFLDGNEDALLPFTLMANLSLPLTEAVEAIYDGKITGAPLSKQYALVSTSTEEQAILYRKTVPIGTVSESIVLTLHEKEYENYSDLYSYPFSRITGGK